MTHRCRICHEDIVQQYKPFNPRICQTVTEISIGMTLSTHYSWSNRSDDPNDIVETIFRPDFNIELHHLENVTMVYRYVATTYEPPRPWPLQSEMKRSYGLEMIFKVNSIIPFDSPEQLDKKIKLYSTFQ